SSIYKLDFSLIESITHLFTNIECSNNYLTFIRQMMHMLGIPNRTNHTLDDRYVEVINFIKQGSLNQYTISSLANDVYRSESRLSHLFKKEVGISLSSYVVDEKLRKAFTLIFAGN